MNRDQLISALRRYARKRGLTWDLDKTKGKGSHYWVQVGEHATTIQSDLNPGRIERILKQLKVERTDL
jgi:heterodisulfide reductase subunit C